MIYNAAVWLYARRQQIKNGILIAAVCVLWGRIAQCSAWKQADDHYGRKVTQVLNVNQQLRQRADSALSFADSVAKSRDARVRKASDRAESASARNNELRAKPIPPSCDTACRRLVAEKDAVIAEFEIAVSDFRAALRQSQEVEAALRRSDTLNRIRADNAERVLSEYKPPKKPSRFSLGCTIGQAVTMWGAGPGGACGVSVRIF